MYNGSTIIYIILNVYWNLPAAIVTALTMFSIQHMFVLEAQKNSLIETVLLSTHNICFGFNRNKKNSFLFHTLNNRPE